ncbi:hypothetical protein GN543_004985 [Salmonella enterica]|uniref:hypothetical protein n=1 Tax=Salmonella enterica TaxID=28901 RepID=UPI001CBF1609|nr:hypothetical protein [Salmonella enterica]EDZ0945599.1 hypothetical protein [Salmonella enterica]EGI5077207.1 hypothetical protein [Salmonella enterica subsp. enterica serovar Infantis]EKQ9927434.1 hypothetical protein [Salmonella enterica subsp. enterica serovar Panama]
MKDIFLIAMAFMTPLLCVIIAGLLAMEAKPGWGWFLFVAALITCSLKISVW